MKKIMVILFLFAATISYAQVIETELNGFRLNQNREVPKNELKTLLQKDKFEDGFEYEIFLLEADSSVYMTFEYADYDLNSIWSAQLTGIKKGYDCGFKGLKLGMNSEDVLKIIGKPSEIVDAGEYGKRWSYEKRNYSFEINPEGKLSSIKIMDNSHDFYPKLDFEKLPSYNVYSKIILSGNRKQIIELLAPGIEIYKNEEAYLFKNSIKKELENDNSGMFKLIKEMAEIIKKTNANDTLQYHESMRIVAGEDAMHVAKFTMKNANSEIVFKYLFGKFLIWEIKLN